MLAPSLLATLLALAPPPAAAEPPPEAALDDAQVPEDAVLDEAAADVLADEPVDPVIAAAMAMLSPEDAEALAALDEAGLQALAEKIDAGTPLSPQEQAIADAFQAAAMEQFEAQLHYETGDVDLGNGLAVLHLGEGFRYLDAAQADEILVRAWGNPPGAKTLGMIFPAETSPLDPELGWGVVITYNADGHVEDDDADDIDYDELLEQMQAGTEEENQSRVAQGYPRMHLRGWAEAPRYDAATHRLYWAKELSVDGAQVDTLNYAIRVLGRRGVLELNAVATMDQLGHIKPAMEDVLSRVEFSTGHRYEDFDPDLDKVAAYGIGGLIAGKVLAKTGLLAGLLKLLVAAKKLLVVAAIGIAVVLKRMLRRRQG